MAARTGDTAQKTRMFRCAHCTASVLVKAGDTIPACPNGHTEFKSRMQGRACRS
jgi:hypothetical protein